MSDGPTRRPVRRHRRASEPEGRERGYTLIMTALLLIPLLAFAGLAVDVGSWYARGTQLQRAADAAALAGAALMPDFTAAQAEAITTARKNAFSSGGPISVSVAQRDERRIAVTIRDTNVTRYFSSLFMSNMTIERTAVAEFVLPVPLGSPENSFGNDPVDPPPGGQPGLWGNIHSVKTDNKKGDRYAAGCRNSSGTADSSGCSSPSNSEYRGWYLYAVDIPPNAGTVSIEAYDAGMYDRGGDEQKETGDRRYNATGTMTTTWTVMGPDQTLMDWTDANTCSTTAIPAETNAATYMNKWATLCSVPPVGEPVRYWIKVQANGGDAANRYALRARSTGFAKATLSAFRDMSMFNNQLTVNPSFYLAQVDPIHKGKTFLVSLYDPGEINVPGAQMQVLRPDGTVAPSCKVSVFNNPTDSSATLVSTRTPCSIPTTETSGQKNPGAALYNGQLLSIDIKIPTDYACTFCWWKIRYDLGPSPSGSPADTTTWSAAIKGDPVHLVNEN